MKSSLGSAVDLDRVLRNFVQTIIRGNAEMAAVQEQSVTTTANLATSQIETLKDMAGETEASIKKLNEVVVSQMAHSCPTFLMFNSSTSSRSSCLYKSGKII